MKKSLIATIVILLIVVIGGYFIFDGIFPKANPIQYPKIDDINSISLEQNDDILISIETKGFEELLHHIANAKPTRKMSVNDYPTVRTYYKVAIDTTEREYRYYVYIEDGYVHIETPYEGIYKSDQQFYDLIEQYNK